MLPVETLLSFFAAACLLALVPGPDNIFVLTQAALRGKGAGLLVTLGLCTGLIGHTVAVSLGIAVIFQTSALAFSILKYLGAAYLLYLAWQAFRAATTPIDATREQTASSARQLYLRGIIMNITNPKVSIFFLAFLPQFVDPTAGPIQLQMIILGGLFIISTILIFGSIALLAGTLGHWLNRSSRCQRWMNRLAGSVFGALALKLALTSR